jgi:hypothetical protein
MANNLWFDSRGVIAGTADLKASGKELSDAFTKLNNAASRIASLSAEKPAGTDETGTEFDKTHAELLDGLVKQGKEVGELVTSLGADAEKALAFFTKTDLESADDLKLA